MADVGKITPGTSIRPKVPRDERTPRERPHRDEQEQLPDEKSEEAPSGEHGEGEDHEGGIDVYV
jgi:hypothetical protein